MAKRSRNRNRYRQMERMITQVLIGNALVFCLYMFAASRIGGWEIVKWICVVVSALLSIGTIGWLYITKELMKRRSLWMLTACVSILACLIVSICLNFPCPPIVSALK